MFRSVRSSLLVLLALGTFAARPAHAGFPSPGNIIVIGSRINLVPYFSTASDPGNSADSTLFKSSVTVLVRDIANNPVPGMPVVLDFSGCTDVRIASAQHFRGETTNCAYQVVQNYSAADGSATFVVIGTLTNRNGHPVNCAKVYVDSYLVGSVNVGVYDQNGLGGMNLADLSLFWADNGSSSDRSNLDDLGGVTLADLSRAWEAFAHGPDRSAVICP